MKTTSRPALAQAIPVRPNLASNVFEKRSDSSNQADKVFFAGRTHSKPGMKPLSQSEAKRLADALHPMIIKTEPETVLPKEELVKSLLSGRMPNTQGEYLAGVIAPDRTIKSSNPEFARMAGFLLSRLPKDIQIPKEGLELVIRLRDPKSLEATRHTLEKNIIPFFQFQGEVPGKDGKPMEVFETVAWPFFEQLITGKQSQLPENVRPLLQEVLNVPLFQIQALNAPELDNAMKAAFEPIKTRLSALEMARMQYFDRVELKEVVSSLLKGAAIGGIGETAIHHFVHEGSPVAGLLRSGLLVAVDMVDNIYGEMGVLTSTFEANGLKLSKESVFGENSWGAIIKNRFQMKGEGAMFARRAVHAALKGAMTGSVMSIPVGMTLSNPDASVLERSVVAGQATVGTAMGIPFNVRATFPQVEETVRHLIQSGKIALPKQVNPNNPKELEKFIRSTAEQELMSRLGFSASMKAFSLVPGSGVILALEKLGVPRSVCQTIFMSISPAMENILRLFFTVFRLKVKGPQDMRKIQEMILDKPDKAMDDAENKRMNRYFADSWSKGLSRFLTHAWAGLVVGGLMVLGAYGLVASKWMGKRGQADVPLIANYPAETKLYNTTSQLRRRSFEDFVGGSRFVANSYTQFQH